MVAPETAQNHVAIIRREVAEWVIETSACVLSWVEWGVRGRVDLRKVMHRGVLSRVVPLRFFSLFRVEIFRAYFRDSGRVCLREEGRNDLLVSVHFNIESHELSGVVRAVVEGGTGAPTERTYEFAALSLLPP